MTRTEHTITIEAEDVRGGRATTTKGWTQMDTCAIAQSLKRHGYPADSAANNSPFSAAGYRWRTAAESDDYNPNYGIVSGLFDRGEDDKLIALLPLTIPFYHEG